jgi:hypothetical protein
MVNTGEEEKTSKKITERRQHEKKLNYMSVERK